MTRRERAMIDAPEKVINGIPITCPYALWGNEFPHPKRCNYESTDDCVRCWDAEWTPPPPEYDPADVAFTSPSAKAVADQSLKHDAGKPKVSLVPLKKTLENVARVFEHGINVEGYKEGSWRDVDLGRYLDSFGRHYAAFHGEPSGFDEKSGLPHLWHLGWHVFVLMELMDVD